MNSETSKSRTPVHGEVHTPGPWKANVMRYRATVHSETAVVAEVIEGDLGKLAQAANAKLIASAPELLKLAELFIAAWEETWIDPDETSLECSDVYRKAKELVRSLKTP